MQKKKPSAEMRIYQHTQDVNKSSNKLFENETNWIKWIMALYCNYLFIGFKRLVRKLTSPILKRRSLWSCQQNRNGVNTFLQDSCRIITVCTRQMFSAYDENNTLKIFWYQQVFATYPLVYVITYLVYSNSWVSHNNINNYTH